jgi:hypothetical protein
VLELADVGAVVGACNVSLLELSSLEESDDVDVPDVVLVVDVEEPVEELSDFCAAATAAPPPTRPATATAAVAADRKRRFRSRSRTLPVSCGSFVMGRPWRHNLSGP